MVPRTRLHVMLHLRCLSRLCTVAIKSDASIRMYVNAVLGMKRAERRAHTLLSVQLLNMSYRYTTDTLRVEYRTNDLPDTNKL